MWWLPLLVLWMEVGDHGKRLYFIHFYILNDIKGWSDQDGKILLDLQHWQGREWFKVIWNSMLTRSENLSLQMNHFLVLFSLDTCSWVWPKIQKSFGPSPTNISPFEVWHKLIEWGSKWQSDEIAWYASVAIRN